MIRVTEPLNFFKEPWYIEWMLREISKAFKDCGDIEKAKKFALSKMKKASEDGQECGTRVDEVIKEYVNKDSASFFHYTKKEKIEVENCLKAFEKWEAVYQPASITTCTRLYATIEGQEVSGEPDIMVDDVLVDIKCASRIDLKHWVQVNMYRRLRDYKPDKPLEDDDGWTTFPITGKVGILRLDKITGSYEYIVQDYNPLYVDCWVGLMRAYCLFKKENVDGDEL